MARTPDVSSQQEEMLDVINRSGEHLLAMVNDVLNLSQIEAGRLDLRLEAFDLVQFLEDIGVLVKSRAEAKGLQFFLELDPQLPRYVQGDAAKIHQVLINLLGNAVKYTETGQVRL